MVAIAARGSRLLTAEAPAAFAAGRRRRIVPPIKAVLIAAQLGAQGIDLFLQRVEAVAQRLQPGAQTVLERADGRQPVGHLCLGVDELRPEGGQGGFQFQHPLAPVGAGLHDVAVHGDFIIA